MNQAYDDQYTVHQQFDEEGMTIRELLSIFRKRFFWFLLGLVLVSGAAVGYLFWATPLYESQVSVLVNPIQNSSSIDSLLSVTSSGRRSRPKSSSSPPAATSTRLWRGLISPGMKTTKVNPMR
ncbi:MAG: Wzz/FepE/Etk N-terminal domain-containing protein [Sphaerochaeta sp.]